MNIFRYAMSDEDYEKLATELATLRANGEYSKADDLIEQVNSVIFAPNPTPVEGGFLAARGAFADTWNGEPAEDTIRRLRDGE
jgi:hypothetical protein